MKSYFPVLAVICGLILLPHSASSETKAQAKKREQAEQQRLQRKVTKVLQGERMGVIPDRQKALKTLIDSGHAPDEAYWQAGYIKKGDQWVSVEQRWLDRDEEAKLDEYAEVRNPAWNTPEANFELAKWCDQNGLHEQARAHLMSILLDHPDNAELRQMLGYQKIGNRWMNEEEFNAAVEAAERLAENLQKWGPVVAEIRKGLDSGDARKQNEARVKLEKIDDLDAIPALELILLPGSERAAAACVDQLSTIKHRDSTLALCRGAMFLPESSKSVKNAAIEEIRTRPLEEFVPVLLSQLQTPLSVQYSFFRRTGFEFSNGPFNLPQQYEMQTSIDWATIQVSNEAMYELRNYSLNLLMGGVVHHSAMVVRNGIDYEPLRMEMRREYYHQFDHRKNPLGRVRYVEAVEFGKRISQNRLLELNRMIDYENESIAHMNSSLTSLLTATTGTSGDLMKPNEWWDWWGRHLDVDVTQKNARELEVLEIPGFLLHIPGSCFVAGTLVWTDSGPRPIEELHIGDSVLTKDVETGELAYKPIIRATVREPNPLVTIDLGPEQITATGGHPFWVSGTGWVRARELKPGQRLHTPTGSIQIESVTEADERETYNLVVDGFHTYFVGQSQLLCHDVSITSPTDAIVPGLIER